MPPDVEKLYAEGYAALDRGDYARAVELAGQCLQNAPPDSYWYAGALGLRCWAANFTGDYDSVARDAHALLALDSGDHKMWFDGLAVFNLALIRRRLGDVGEAEMLFDQARAKYAAYRIPHQSPDDWRLVRELFEAVAHWAAGGETVRLDDLAGRLSVLMDNSGEIPGLQKAVDLYQRRARGEDVTKDARRAFDDGVSRAFLAALII